MSETAQQEQASAHVSPPPGPVGEAVRPPALTSKKGWIHSFKGVFSDYYAPMRFLGYVFAALGDKMSGWIQTAAKSFLDRDVSEKQAKQYVGYTEALFFGGLTLAYYFDEKGKIGKNLLPAVAAERRQELSGMTSADVSHSSNPIIQTAAGRLTRKTWFRGISDLAFVRSVLTGIVAQAGRVTVERTVFNQPTAYDRLIKLFGDVQGDHFDIQSNEKVSRELANVIQQSQKDHGRAPWERSVVEAYRPFFDALAVEVIEKRMGIAEVTYLLGETIVRRLTPQDAMAEFHAVKGNGLLNAHKAPHSKSEQPMSAAPPSPPPPEKPGKVLAEKAPEGAHEMPIESARQPSEPKSKEWAEEKPNPAIAAKEMLAEGPKNFFDRNAVEAANHLR